MSKPTVRALFETVLDLNDSWSVSRYASVNRWVKALKRRGDRRATRRTYFKCLSNFLRFLNLTAAENSELGNRNTPLKRKDELFAKVARGINPDTLLELGKSEIEEKIQAFCDTYNNSGKARSAHAALNCLRSFFKHNGTTKLDLDGYQWRKNRRPEYVPTKEEVYRMADRCDERGKAIILCTFQSGLRNSALRALKYGDVKEQLEAAKIPVTIHVDARLRARIPEACKEDAEYFTFFAKDAAQALSEYIQWRKNKYKKIEDDEPLFMPYEAFNFKLGNPRTHASEDSLERLVKRAAKRAKIKEWQNIRFHSLRKSFRSILDAGYTDGGQMAEDDKEYLMGHRLPAQKEPYHNANVTTLAERHTKLKWALETTMTHQAKLDAIKAFAKTLGIENIEVKIAKIRKINPNLNEEEAVGHVIREGLGINQMKIETARKTENNNAKKVVNEKDLERYLANGWDVQMILPSGKILVKKLPGP